MKKAMNLRVQLLIPLAVTILLLWAGTMLMLTHSKINELEERMAKNIARVYSDFNEQMEYFQNNVNHGLGEEADCIWMNNLSGTAMSLEEVNGGIAIAMQGTSGAVIQTQLAWGYAHEDGVDQGQRWQLLLDHGLDDNGQIALTKWIIDHRDGDWSYRLWPPESQGDGTIARVTGQKLYDTAIDVERIELVHPDGTEELVVETSSRSAEPQVWEFRYMMLGTVLLPPYYSDGRKEYGAIEKRLENFRSAHIGLAVELGGENEQVTRRIGSYKDDLAKYELTAVYNVKPAALRQLTTVYLSTLLLTIVILAVLSQVLTKKVTIPVEQLCREVKEGHCEGDSSVQELNVLAASFNEARDKLEEQLRREREFTRAAAHELKTPLAVLRTHTEALQEDILPAKREHYLGVVMDETDHMSDLVSRLLELSRLESGAAMTHEMVELSSLVREIFDPLLLSLEHRHMKLDLRLAEIWIEADRVRLKEAIGNLAANALRYGACGGTVLVTLTEAAQKIQLCVTNDSPPIPEEALPHLFEPFYRVDKARSREAGGSGLGLAIVKAAVEAHGGSCHVQNLTGAVQFQIELPVRETG